VRVFLRRLVVALGGNALQEAGAPATAEAQLEVVRKTARYIADLVERGYEVILAHGNGPQVGRIVLQNEGAAHITPAMPFDVCGAMSQGMKVHGGGPLCPGFYASQGKGSG
jgi:carbamate kinase